MADGGMLPMAEVGFDFILPHGIDTDDDVATSEINAYKSANPSPDHEMMEDIQQTSKPDDGLAITEANVDQHEASFDMLQERFPEDVCASEAPNCSGSEVPKNKKSRRTDDDEQDNNERSKKPRQSLFGPQMEDPEGDGLDDLFEEQPGDLLNQENDMNEPGIPETGIGSCLSSLNLEQQTGEYDHPKTPSDSGSIIEYNDTPFLFSQVVIPPDPQALFGLRTGIDRDVPTTHVDQDESGNFDPTAEMRERMLKLQQAKAAKAAKRSKKGKERAPEEKANKCIVKLRFEAFGNVRNATNDEENWPDDWSVLDSEFEREKDEDRAWLRRRTPHLEMQSPIEDPLDECVDGNDYCSFEDEPDQIICDNCLNRVHICHALPPEGYRNDRISIDEIMYGENKRHIACTSCRQGKKRCSLKKKTDKPPCKNCKKNEIGCTFYDIPKKAPKKKASKGKRPAKDDSPEPTPLSHAYFTAEDLEDLNNTDQRIISRSPTPEIELEDTAGHRGVLTKINTSFSHPIKFGMIENTSDCNFCELPIYSFVGLFEKEVHVICWENGQGYTEVGGGHMEKNGPTTMCQYCTTSRAQTIICESHDIQRMETGFRGTISGFEEALYDLFEFADEPYEIKKQLQQWCSMCFSPAAFACRTRQAAFLSPDDTRELIDGCGLKLCTRCEEQLREVFGGDSSVMAATLDLEPKAKELDNDVQGLVIRADVGFLSSEGILMKNLEYELEKKRLQNEADEGNI
ncbi:C6 zinc finger domain protein [Pyrenophora tritici-repentis]|nr:C6 zinc finger domain protein [Pyrenophora tritici-repentis]